MKKLTWVDSSRCQGIRLDRKPIGIALISGVVRIRRPFVGRAISATAISGLGMWLQDLRRIDTIEALIEERRGKAAVVKRNIRADRSVNRVSDHIRSNSIPRASRPFERRCRTMAPLPHPKSKTRPLNRRVSGSTSGLNARFGGPKP